MKFLRSKRVIPLSILLVLGLVFYFRSPVLIITDASFGSLYGQRRLWFRNAKTSLELFRRVIPVMVYENTGSSQIALAASYASSSPRAVIFPYRYMDAAILYKEMFPESETIIMGGRNTFPGEEHLNDLYYVQSHTELDLYRAALYAAELCQDKDVLLISSDQIPDVYREAFMLGLNNQGFTASVIYSEQGRELPSLSNIGCIVLLGSPAAFLIDDLRIPVILFSWINPVNTPRSVKLIFDDSPWALAREILNSDMVEGEEIMLPSSPLLLLNRMEKILEFFEISPLLKENF